MLATRSSKALLPSPLSGWKRVSTACHRLSPTQNSTSYASLSYGSLSTQYRGVTTERNFASVAAVAPSVEHYQYPPPPVSAPAPSPKAVAAPQPTPRQSTSPAPLLVPVPANTEAEAEAYWKKIDRWKDVSEAQFMSYQWQLDKALNTKEHLYQFLREVLPERLGQSLNPRLQHIKTPDAFIEDVKAGLSKAPMTTRLTPHICSVIDWNNALDDPIRLQFLPLRSSFLEDHEALTLDSLGEKDDSPVKGLVHRYPDKALFLATSTCPVYCRFCTRSYAIGPNSETVQKDRVAGGGRRRWEKIYEYIRKTPALTDIVVSGGDTYYLPPDALKEIGETLLNMPHIRRIRFASKGLAVTPNRTIDPDDEWTSTLIELSNYGRSLGKHVCLHTHFNHPNEITWVTKKAARHLFKHGVIVRNQSVLLKGVNDKVETMATLIRSLADMNIQPYYVYQCDLVKGVEDLRTPLSVILDMEQKIRGTIAGFMMPTFVVDLPGGGGKRLAAAHESYDAVTGISVYKAPGLLGEKGQKLYTYYDPKPAVQVTQSQKSASQPVGIVEDVARRTTEIPMRNVARTSEGIPAYQPTLSMAALSDSLVGVCEDVPSAKL